MVSNPERRTTLLNAAIDVLAKQGARGLTFRAVDVEAGVPVGTASNYFDSRDDLLAQAGGQVFVRLTPGEDHVAELMAGPRTREHEIVLMRDIILRAHADREGYLAMLELRLEATRRPEVREALTRYYRANLEAITVDHVEGGFPGDRTTAVVLYLAMTGLIVEHLTLPDVLSTTAGSLADLVADIVRRIVPEQ